MRVTIRLPDFTAELETSGGLFSNRAVDRGTFILLSRASHPTNAGHMLDLGCGYGPIAVTLAARAPEATIWAVDSDEVALEATAANVGRLGLTNVIVAAPREVPLDLRFKAIYSNPPIKIGKQALHSLLVRWLSRLEPGGAAHLVVKKAMGADSLATWLEAEGFKVRRSVSKNGYRILTTGSS